MLVVFGVIVASAVLSLFAAVLSINETIIQLFVAINFICAVLAIWFAISDRQPVAIAIAASPFPLGLAAVLAWVIAMQALNGERHWAEVVHLASGHDIVVQRSFERPGLLGGDPIVNGIEANFSHAGHIKWSGHLELIALDEAETGDVYLVTVVTSNYSRSEYSVPENIHHVAFRYEGNNKWVRLTLEQIPSEIKANLLISVDELFIKHKFDSHKLVDLSVKQDADSDPRIWNAYRSWAPAKS